MKRWFAALALVVCAACASTPSAGVVTATPSPTPATSHLTASPSDAETPPSPPAHWDAPSPTFAFDAGSSTDIFTWSGQFVSTAGIAPYQLSHNGRYYVTLDGRIWSAAGALVGSDLNWGKLPTIWTGDGDYLCGADEDAVYVTGVDGQTNGYPIANGGNPSELYGCSVNTDRAALLEPVPNAAVMSVVSLRGGNLINVVHLVSQWKVLVVSPDVKWLAETSVAGETDIVDLGDGTIKARFPHATIDSFFADGYVVTLEDGMGPAAREVNWQTGKQLWSSPGRIAGSGVSDLATDKEWVWVTEGASGAATDDYWILDDSGNSIRFHPKP